MDAQNPRTVRLVDYAPPDYLIDAIGLDIRLAPRGTCIIERLDIKPNPDLDIHGPLRLDGENLELVRIVLDGEILAKTEYAVDTNSLTIGAPPTDPFNLEIEVRINPEANTALSGLYLTGGVYCTQCEAEGFRRIAYGLDRPDVLSEYTTRIEAPKARYPVLLSNGNLVEAGDCPGTDRHFAIWHDPHPKPTYLFALVGGDLAHRRDSFRTMSGRDVDLRIYVEPGKVDRTEFAMAALKRAMKWDETAYGRQYDLDIFMIIAVSDFNIGAMENKGLNVFNDKFILASPDTATDADYGRIEAIIAHEYFHNWTGNRITCRDWFQLCLKEGLTVFRDQEFTRDMRSGDVKRIEDVRTLRAHQFPEDAGPLAHPVRPQSYIEINNFYTATVYKKGAELIAMLKTMLGSDAFRRGMDLYFERHDGEAACVEDLVSALADGGGRDFSNFLKWYDQAGTPKINVRARYDADARALDLTIRQSTGPTPGQPDKSALHMPFAIGLLDRDGTELPLVEAHQGEIQGGIVEITRAQTHLRFNGIKAPPVLSLNRNFSAPVTVDADLTVDDLLVLLTHDSDGFNRWQAAQSLGLAAVVSQLADDPPPWATRFFAALGSVITDETLVPAFRAEVLRMPSEADIALEITENVDTDAIHAARDACLSAMARHLAGELEDLRRRHRPAGSYSPEPGPAGQRALANAALDLAVRAGDGGAKIAFEAYRSAANMTDTIAALTALTHMQAPQRGEALDDFYRRYRSEPLIVDKWLTLQAIAARPTAATDVARLTRHEAFTLKNPNRVRALIGAFAMANPVGFNAADGTGYTLVAETVLELDRLNPPIGALLLGAFRSWRKLEPKRRSRAENALTHIAGQAKLSPDVYEIATKSLA